MYYDVTLNGGSKSGCASYVAESSCLGLELKKFLEFFPATEDITDRGPVSYISSVLLPIDVRY